jgi:hypothetical protein
MNGIGERTNDSAEQPARKSAEGQSRSFSLCCFENQNGTGMLFEEFSEEIKLL